MSSSGNDTRSREAATTVWVSNPQETAHVMKKLLKKIDIARGDVAVFSPRNSVNGNREAQIEAAIQAATNASLV